MTSRIEWITGCERYAELRRAWNQLAETAARPFSEHEWFELWWKAFAAGRRLQICVLWRDAELVAAFPLCEGDGSTQALANVHTPSFAPLARSADDLRDVVRAVFDRGCPELRVGALAADEPAFEELQRSSANAGRWSLISPTQTSPIVHTTGAPSDYFARPGLTGPLPRYRRKMAREHEAEFQT